MPNYTSPFGGTTNFQNTFWETNPEAAYQLWSGAVGFGPGGNQRRRGYANSMYNWFNQDYLNQSIRQPDLTWTSYLDRMGSSGNSLESMWNALSPRDRGERGAAPVKWV